jgi:hypothetical protein
MNQTTATTDCAWIKLDLLARGVKIDQSVSDFAASKNRIALRNNVYNTPLWLETSRAIPQELRVSGLVVSLNSYGESPWHLSWNSKTETLLLEHTVARFTVPVEGIRDLDLFAHDPHARQIANLYGGAALAFFLRVVVTSLPMVRSAISVPYQGRR